MDCQNQIPDETKACATCGLPTEKPHVLDGVNDGEPFKVTCLCKCGIEALQIEQTKAARHERKMLILDCIRKNKSVSCAGLEYCLDRTTLDYHGDSNFCSGACEGVVFWTGWNADIISILNELMKEGFISYREARGHVYLLEGKCVSLPLVRSNGMCQAPHWLPIIFEIKKSR